MEEYLMKQIIEEEGGKWIGHMAYPGNPLRDIVLFNDKNHYTLALYVIEFSREKVQAKLRSKPDA